MTPYFRYEIKHKNFCIVLQRESERNKALKLLSKIYGNIINNPTQTSKYGNLNLAKINEKLSTCKPALKLLYLSGFEKSKDNTRLIWKNANDNMNILHFIYHHAVTFTKRESLNAEQKQQHMQQRIIKTLSLYDKV